MALQVKELMVGDWVATEYDGNIKVSAVLTGTVYNNKDIGFNNGEIYPIPLTEEILKANGAYDGRDGRSIIIDCYYIGAKDVVSLCEYKGGFEISVLTCVDMTGEPNEVYDLPSVKYVHELQRILRCCGLWDLADNFKL